MLLALVLLTRDQRYLLRKSLITRGKSRRSSYLSPDHHAFPHLCPFYSPHILGRRQLNQHYLPYVLISYVQVSPVFHIASITLLEFSAFLRPSSTLPGPLLQFPSLGSGPQRGAAVSLEHRVLRLWLLVTRWHHPLARVFWSTSGMFEYTMV